MEVGEKFSDFANINKLFNFVTRFQLKTAMNQENGISTYNPSETYMGPMVLEYEQPTIDMELFIDTPLNLNIYEKSLGFADKSPHEVTCIHFKDKLFVLKKPLYSKVVLKSDMWYITNEYLTINVWGETYDKVIEAFNFTFYSTYKNFVVEDDAHLSAQGIELKNKMNDLILFFNES
jgi:hypothetical protein